MVLNISKKDMKFYAAIALVIGTVIGAGVFGIPYAISKSGFILGMINIIFVGFMTTIMTLYMGEVVLRTKEKKQFVGLAEKYLGKYGKWLMFASIVMGIYGALTAYLVGIGESLSFLFGGNPLIYSLLFFIVSTPIILIGLRTILGVEFGLSISLVVTFIAISLILIPKINMANLSYINLSKAFYPYGVILFATLGYSVIPEVKMVLNNQKNRIMHAIVIAMIVCITIYTLFSFSIIGVYGKEISEIATKSLNGGLSILGTTVALLAMATGFLALSMVLKDVYSIDIKINKKTSFALVSLIPLMIILFLSPSFVTVISLTGAYGGGLTGVLCALMIKEARKKGEVKPNFVVPGGNFLIYLSILVFIMGIIFQTMLII